LNHGQGEIDKSLTDESKMKESRVKESRVKDRNRRGKECVF